MRWVHAYMGERVISRLGGRMDWRPAVAVSSDAWKGEVMRFKEERMRLSSDDRAMHCRKRGGRLLLHDHVQDAGRGRTSRSRGGQERVEQMQSMSMSIFMSKVLHPVAWKQVA